MPCVFVKAGSENVRAFFCALREEPERKSVPVSSAETHDG